MRAISANEVTSVIRRKLKKAIAKDFSGRPFRIFRERDLHACCYFHLRRFLRSDRAWEILNEPLLRGLKGKGRSARPDIVLFHNGKPVFLIELKFRRNSKGASSKDRRVLRNSVRNKKWAKKAFYLEAVIQASTAKKRKLVPYRNRSISIFLREDRRPEYNTYFKGRRKPLPRR